MTRSNFMGIPFLLHPEKIRGIVSQWGNMDKGKSAKFFGPRPTSVLTQTEGPSNPDRGTFEPRPN